jgi:N-methylhydantoinase A
VVNIHLVAFGILDKAKLEKLPASSTTNANVALIGKRLVDFDKDTQLEAAIYDREKLQPGMTFKGPAIIEESTTTTVVLPDNRVEVDDFGGLHIYLRD